MENSLKGVRDEVAAIKQQKDTLVNGQLESAHREVSTLSAETKILTPDLIRAQEAHYLAGIAHSEATTRLRARPYLRPLLDGITSIVRVFEHLRSENQVRLIPKRSPSNFFEKARRRERSEHPSALSLQKKQSQRARTPP